MREFVMGARLNMDEGGYTSAMGDAVRATNQFSDQLSEADRVAGRFYDKTGKLREANGRFVQGAARATTATDRQKRSIRDLLGLNGRFASSTDRATQEMREQTQVASSLRDRLFSLQGIVTAVAGSMAIRGAYNWLVGANADMEQYQNTLTVVLGSQEKAIEQMAWAEKFAAKTPFEIPEIIEATTRLESYGIASKDVMGITGDMASVMGKDLMQAVEALADAQTGELERLKEFGITKGMIEEQAKLMGKAVTNNKGQITDQEQFNKTLFAIMEERFSGGMEMQSKSFKGMLSNASDFMSSMGRRLGQPLFEKAKSGMQGFLGFLNRLDESGAVDGFIASVQTGFSKFGSVISSAIAPFKALYDMMLGSGDMSYFVELFGLKGAVGLNNALWDIVDVLGSVWSFATTIVFPALKDGFFIAVGAVKELAGWILSQYSYFQKFVPYIQGLAIAFAAYYAIMKTITMATKLWGMAQAAVNIILSMNPIMLIVITIGLLIGYLIHLAGGWDVVRAKLAILWAYLVSAWSSIWATLQPIFTLIGQKAVQIWQWLAEVVPPYLLQLWNLLSTFFMGIFETALSFFNSLRTGIMNIFNALQSFWSVWGGLITAVFQVLWAMVSSIFLSAVSILWAIVMGAFDYITNIISGFYNIIVGIIQIGWSLISGIFSTALNLLSGNWEGAWDSMLDMLSGVWSGIETFFGGLKDLFFDSGVAIMKTLAEGITSMISAPFKAVKSGLEKVRELLPFSDAKTGPLSSLTHNGGKIVSTMAEGVYKQAGTLERAMSYALGGVPQSTSSVVDAYATSSGTVDANGYRINPSGVARSERGGNTFSIKSLVEKLVIQGSGKDPKELADELLEIIYEELKQAKEVLSSGDWGALLND